MNLLSKLTFLPPCNQVNHHYQFDWSASGFQFAFSGKSIELQITSHHTLYGPVILAVFVDGEVYQKIDLSEGSHAYTIPFTRNDIIYVKFIQITELQYGSFKLEDIRVDGEIFKWDKPQESILWIGDSLSAGYGLESDTTPLVFNTHFEDCTHAYPYMVSHALNTTPIIIAYSGNGILSRWIPETEDAANDEDILPSIFPYNIDEDPSWVIINLGTNDASYTRGIPEREQRFQKLYIDFIQTLQAKFPNAKFLLCYGLMEETLLSSVQKVAKETSSLFLRFDAATEKDGFCFASHPNKTSQRNAANTLIHFIRTHNEETL
ncbi:MAG: hypothetical protein HXL43_03935 [Solobacterium sp.]|nr:hypothetical protein [Solobacterium sp.]